MSSLKYHISAYDDHVIIMFRNSTFFFLKKVRAALSFFLIVLTYFNYFLKSNQLLYLLLHR